MNPQGSRFHSRLLLSFSLYILRVKHIIQRRLYSLTLCFALHMLRVTGYSVSQLPYEEMLIFIYGEKCILIFMYEFIDVLVFSNKFFVHCTCLSVKARRR